MEPTDPPLVAGDPGSAPPALPEPLPPRPPTPFGFWATAGLTAAVLIATMMTAALVLIGAIVVGRVAGFSVPMEDLGANGLFVALSTWVSAPVEVGLIWLMAGLRRGLTAGDYLALRPVSLKALGPWLLALAGLIAAADSLSYVLGKPIVPEFMERAYASAGFAPLLWLALIVAAPVSEEILFRGFFITGARYSRLGDWGAVVLSSLGWSAIHVQYDAYGIANIFVAGLLLGWARLKTRSIFTPMLLHALMNLVATVETAVKAHLG